MKLVCVGINHHTAGLSVRERYAVPGDELPVRLRTLVDHAVVTEAVIVNTCNRVEVYAVSAPGADMQEVLSVARETLGEANPAVYSHVGADAVRHLFRVSASLDSMVVGEPQILGQIKEAVGHARDARTVGSVLDGTFSRAFRSAKRVRTETSVGRAAVSVGYVAVELAKTIFGDVSTCGVLLVGAGKMGILAAKNLSDSGARDVHVANRTFARGKEVAGRFGWSPSAWGDLPILLGAADVVICSTGSPRPVLTPDLVAAAVKRRRYRPLFLIDIAVPRDIDPRCGDIDDVYLYDIDDLEEVSRSNSDARKEAVTDAEAIVDEELRSYATWRLERKAAPTIQQLREKAIAMAQAEAQRTIRMMPALDDQGAAAIQKLAEVVAMKLLRGPMTALKRDDGTRRADVSGLLRDVFDLDGE